MAMDFVQIDSAGNLTGRRVPLWREDHLALFWELSPGEFPLLARMGDYYEDATFDHSELPELVKELQRLITVREEANKVDLVRRMIAVVEHSILNALDVEVIAD